MTGRGITDCCDTIPCIDVIQGLTPQLSGISFFLGQLWGLIRDPEQIRSSSERAEVLKLKKGERMEPQQSLRERSLAWFKIADLIARGEREKALSVFRLLSHSLADQAYVLQLEADILWHMDDKGAVDKYRQAAFLYHKEKRLVDAIAIYEHLLMLEPDSYDHLSVVLVFYALLDWPERFAGCYQRLEELFKTSIIDELQLEKAIRDVFDVANGSDQKNKKAWFFDWFKDTLSTLPDGLATRLQGLL